MTNEEYQRQAAERSRQADEERRRQAIEDSNRHQREQAARNAQIQKENYSRQLGSMGAGPSIFGPPVDGPTYRRARQAYDANKQMLDNFNQTTSSIGSSRGSGGGTRSRGRSGGAGFVILIVVIAGIWYLSSHGSNTSTQNASGTGASPSSSGPSAGTQSASPIPKPSPIGHDQSTQMVVPEQQANASAATAPPLGDGAVAAPAVPAPGEAAAPSLPLGVRMPANRDGFNNGCKHGELVLEATTVQFSCPSDESKSVMISAGQVKDVDGNGLQVYPKQKYHFDIDGMRKDQVHGLFMQWLENARRSL